MATYKELATAAKSGDFIDRVTLAVAYYARYILNEDPGTTGHTTRYDWAKDAFTNPSAQASRLLYSVILDDAFASLSPLDAAAVAGVSDATLQAAVEAVLNTTILKY